MSDLKLATKSLHAGYEKNNNEGTTAVPIYQSSAYVFKSTKHAADLFSLADTGYIYTRLNNPTNDILEQRLTALEGGIGAATFASGTSAVSSTLLTLLKAGDHIVASNSLYGGNFNLLNVTLKRFGITTTFVDPENVENFTKATQENTRAFFIESIGNPKLDVLDIKGIAEQAKVNKVPLIVDNTLATPALLKPIELGANITIYSLTKYIGGQGNSLGGAVIDGGNFDWSNGKFPELTEPSEGYHGLKYHEALGEAAFIAKLRLEGLRDLGGALSPYNSFQILQGLETLELRIKKHSENALTLAKWLETREEVEWVNYPGLESHKDAETVKSILSKGQSGIVTFGLKGGFKSAQTVADNTKIFALAANFGDSKSLLIHPASTTHQQLTIDQQIASGALPELIRLSVGLENVEDLKTDLENAFSLVKEATLNENTI